jgi:secondary thiamine-phosphate synthase enzyme
MSRLANPSSRLSAIIRSEPTLVATAALAVDTRGEGFAEITRDAAEFLERAGAGDGLLLLFIRHTSASLVIQENADPDVQTDLATALRNLAPAQAPWVHSIEGPDDMPAHVKAMLTGVSLHVPVAAGKLSLGTWQGIYIAEHRSSPHSRKVILQFIGNPRRP